MLNIVVLVALFVGALAVIDPTVAVVAVAAFVAVWHLSARAPNDG